jgi:hypothetical protein
MSAIDQSRCKVIDMKSWLREKLAVEKSALRKDLLNRLKVLQKCQKNDTK